jgi:hypothetical protein
VGLNNVSPTGVSVVSASPANITSVSAGSCGSWAGLYNSYSIGQSELAGDASHSCWDFSVGMTSSWGGSNGVSGIPCYTTDGNPLCANVW